MARLIAVLLLVTGLLAAQQIFIRVPSALMETKLVERIDPEYPKRARALKLTGEVRFDAHIDKDGTVKELKLLSGHPMLVEAAEKAVKQWKYEPTYMLGKRAEILTVISIQLPVPRSRPKQSSRTA